MYAMICNDTKVLIIHCLFNDLNDSLDMIGFVPAAYLEVVGDAPPDSLPPPQETEASNDDGNISNNGAYIDKEVRND